ncbi:hypothetical protein D3C87_1249370 [compost metagenome]
MGSARHAAQPTGPATTSATKVFKAARRDDSSGRFKVAMPSADGINPKRSLTRCARCQACSCSALLARH